MVSYLSNFISSSAEADRILKDLQEQVQFLPRSYLTMTIYGKTNQLPRDKQFYGDVAEDGSRPLYRYTGNEQPTVHPWTPVLQEMRDLIFKETGHWNNHIVVN